MSGGTALFIQSLLTCDTRTRLHAHKHIDGSNWLSLQLMSDSGSEWSLRADDRMAATR